MQIYKNGEKVLTMVLTILLTICGKLWFYLIVKGNVIHF